jgi:hypothetical protein
MEAAAVPGELCRDDCDGLSDRKRRQLAGLKRGPAGNSNEPYDPTKRPSVDELTEDERQREILRLTRTQGVSVTEQANGRRRNPPIAGGAEYEKQVAFAYGTNPDEIDGVGWSPLA